MRIFDEYFAYLHEYHVVPQLSFFTNHTDNIVTAKMASLLHTSNQISPNWSATYGIETLNGELNYLNEVDSSISYFELKKILKMQEEIMKRFANEKDPAKIAILQNTIGQLKAEERAIIKKHGTVVLKIARAGKR